jgi:2-aminoadipate transaminase
MTPRPQLDPAAPEPLYRQLFEQLREAIERGRLAPGDRLPPTRNLAEQLGVNRATVIAAYDLLEAAGLISRHVGRGSYVLAAPPPARTLDWARLFVAGDREPPPAPAAADDVISFATSRPSRELFPMEEFRQTVAEVLEAGEAVDLLQLGSPGGYSPLRRFLLEQAQAAGVARPGDDVMVTSGCQQALDLIQRVLIARGDAVAVEDPVYPGIHHVLSRAGARLLGLPVEGEGIDPERLERLLRQERPKLLVVTPNFQNPTGATMPLAARLAVVRAARAAGVVVVENDIYGRLRYAGAPLATLKQLDESGDVVQLGSFSKVAFPGLRVGWVVAPRALVAQLVEAKQWADLHTDHLSQAILLRFAVSGRLEKHLRCVIRAGAERLAAAVEACREHLPRGARFTRPQGGMNLWVELPERLDTAELLGACQRRRVSYLPGKYFAVCRPHTSSLRLSFAGLAPDRIREGIAILGELFRSELERRREAAYEPAPAMV